MGRRQKYDGPARHTSDDDPSLADGEERLTARVAFVLNTVTVTDGDGNTTTYDGAEEASTLYKTLAGLDLSSAGSYSIQHYKSPVGAVTTEEVQAFYREHPDLQPTDADGKAYVPTSFSPERHIVAAESGN